MRFLSIYPEILTGKIYGMARCSWAEGSDDYRQYHDLEWGVPSYDDHHLFEMLILEGAQAGLSWSTILHRRDGYREAFSGFDVQKVASFSNQDEARLLTNIGIIRNRAKISASIINAQKFMEVSEKFGSFASFAWQFVDGIPVQNNFRSLSDIPAETAVSIQLSKELKRRGFKFVGPTIMYAYMQSVGMVNDHIIDCPRHSFCQKLGLKP